ncbi:Sensor histidine kinase RcsC [Methylobacterium tardum]|jgi:PAS domain S-box-containing protein|uniref:histidine kinase n=1 Tax=Methylobacterium tardum TaxID=374432 RepID=A0AA37TFX7_9HYPH|nr:PAS domain-containing protein [Methylobacterium tardum]GJE47303.1 Sensor histidine kinase RcsC [Methylobacterium tardum]GLS71325.1 histidine kinase [Methylobacterium tardum]
MTTKASLFAAGGFMGALMGDHDWATTSLGSPQHWPQSLVTLMRVMLNSRQPMFIAWGPDRTLVYNDSYAPMLGARHPAALGRPFFETWPEVRDEVGALMDRVFAGEPVHMDDLQLTLHRNGYPEEAHFSFSYTPVPGDDGRTVGLFCACTETTRQVLTERQAASERQRQQALLQQMPGFVAVLGGRKHVFEYVNDAYIAVAGQRDYIGRPVRDVFPELRDQGFFELLDRVYATGEAFAARTVPIRFTDGDDRYLDFLYQPIRDEAGAVTGIFVGGYEVTEQVRSRAALAESESRYRTLFETIDVGFCIIAMKFDETNRAIDYRITEANPAFERQTGANVTGRWVSEFAPNLEPQWLETYGRVALTGQPAHLENWAEVFGRWFDVRALRVGDPAAHRVAIFFTDISERKRMEEALRVLNATLEQQVSERTAERDLLATIVERTDAMVMAADLDYDILAINKANADEFERIYGVRPKVGDNMLGLLADQPEHQAQVRAGWGRGLAGEEVTIIEDYGDPARVRPYYEISFRTLRNERGERIGCYQFVTDVTERLRDQAELAQAQEALRQSQKLEAVGQLTGGVAHDFNNLLTIIRSSVDFLRRPDLAEERKGRYLDAVSDTVERAAKLTGQLLAFARRQALKPEVFDVGQRVSGIADMLDTVTGARVRVLAEVPDEPCFIRADLSQFETALVNMAVNARDAMDGEGTLTLRLVRGAALPAIRGHAGSDQAFAAVSLIDTGAGIPPERLGRIFEPFFTTKEVGKGTGLGLSQVFGFAKQSGGDVDVRSTVGEGATFTLYLPEVTPEELPASASRPDHGMAPLGAGQCVLVVEDNVGVGQFATQILEDLGYSPTWAANAEEALDRLGRTGNGFDLVFSDVVMPGMGGMALAKELQRRLPGLPVVLASGYSHVLAQEGTHGFELLHKPYSAEQLGRILHQVLGLQSGHRSV